jgi:hypothetical protein
MSGWAELERDVEHSLSPLGEEMEGKGAFGLEEGITNSERGEGEGEQ